MKKENIIQIIIIIILAIILGVFVIITIDEINRNNPNQVSNRDSGLMQNPNDQTTEKETTASDIDTGEEITENNIDLNQYSSNITITKSGEYTLQGEFKNTVLVNAEDSVTLILNGVDIQNDVTAAIANIGENALIIKLEDNSSNTLSDGGSSEYDGCIYSKGAITIEGNGTLNVYGNQEEGEGIATETNDITINGGNINIECQDDGINAGGDGGLITINGGEVFIKANGDGIDSNKNLIINGGSVYTIGSSVGGDAGIDTDEGFTINGGEVIALGSDMLKEPENTSTQKSVCFELNEKISEGTEITLKNENDEEIITFEAKGDFKTLIISNSSISSGTYYLYQNGEKTDYTAEV